MKSRENNTFERHPLSFRLLQALAFVLLWALPASSQVRVNPEYIFMKSKDRAGKFSITNPFTIPVECWVEVKFGYATMVDSGRATVVYDSTGYNDLSKWVKVFPKRFTVDENESQVVRLMVSPPTTLTDGEYWARIVIAAKPSNPIAKKLAGGHGANVVQVSSIDVPLHFRVGKVTTGADLSNAYITYNKDTKKIHFSADVTHSGNASTWGTLNLVLVDKKNNVVGKFEHRFVAYQNYRFLMEVDGSKIPSGTYTARATVSSKREDLASNFILPFKLPETILELTIP